LKLLVPIDGSKPSENALQYAVKLQQQFISGNSNKEIIILNVIPHFHIPLGFEKQMKSLKTSGPISYRFYQ
jgi:nucleotide-binding universal stress UspA family protein